MILYILYDTLHTTFDTWNIITSTHFTSSNICTIGLCWKNVQDGNGDKLQRRRKDQRQHLRIVHRGMLNGLNTCYHLFFDYLITWSFELICCCIRVAFLHLLFRYCIFLPHLFLFLLISLSSFPFPSFPFPPLLLSFIPFSSSSLHHLMITGCTWERAVAGSTPAHTGHGKTFLQTLHAGVLLCCCYSVFAIVSVCVCVCVCMCVCVCVCVCLLKKMSSTESESTAE